ncbi:hypothetical protein HY490_05515 [Candidatus Woesearchaeota archaeon]|nr:hypothetical protein [Candidatus Woesearchaeota archaeon]
MLDILREMSRGNVSIHPLLERGSVVQKSWGLLYEIDDPDCDRRLGVYDDGVVPMGPIYRGLNSSAQSIREIFDKHSVPRHIKRVAPFSVVIDKGVGECLEKAVLVQLAAQRRDQSFLINGTLAEDGDVGVTYHAFNIICRDGSLFLLDAQNPFSIDERGNIRHYIMPVKGIHENGDVMVPEEFRAGRTYSLW